MAIVQLLEENKIDAIRNLRFGGFIQVATRELRHKLCYYLVAQYDFGYHCIRLERDRIILINFNDVRDINGIPCRAVDI